MRDSSEQRRGQRRCHHRDRSINQSINQSISESFNGRMHRSIKTNVQAKQRQARETDLVQTLRATRLKHNPFVRIIPSSKMARKHGGFRRFSKILRKSDGPFEATTSSEIMYPLAFIAPFVRHLFASGGFMLSTQVVCTKMS